MSDSNVRAEDLLDRLTDCGLAQGVSQDDLSGQQVRQQFRSMCSALVDAVEAASPSAPPADRKGYEGAVRHIRDACASAQSDKGKLDRALRSLLLSFDSHVPAKSRLEVLEYLVAHVQAGRMLMAQQALSEAEQQDVEMEPASPSHAKRDEATSMAGLEGPTAASSATLHDLAALLHCDSSASSALPVLKAISAAVDQLLPRLPTAFLDPILPPDSLNENQMSELQEVDKALRGEYSMRRCMLIERAKVTLQSFMWAEKLQGSADKEHAQAAADKGEALMHSEPAVSLEDVFAAKQGDIVPIASKATSGDKGKFDASVKGFIIGAVPDRGGRPTEGRAAQAAANMPSWKPRSAASHDASGGQGGRGRGRHGGGRRGGRDAHQAGGGRVQGGWHGSQDGDAADQQSHGKRGRRGGWGRGQH